jgi:hypothetical protein
MNELLVGANRLAALPVTLAEPVVTSEPDPATPPGAGATRVPSEPLEMLAVRDGDDEGRGARLG